MALTINPAVSGGRRRWLLQASVFGASVFVGAAATVGAIALVMTGVGRIGPPRLETAIAAAVCAAAIAREAGVPVPLPYRHGQVPEWFRGALPPTAVSISFGVLLGTGFATYFTTSAQLVSFVAAPLLVSPAAVLLGVGMFAGGKCAVLTVGARATSNDSIVCSLHDQVTSVRIARAGSAGLSLCVLGFLLVR